MIFLVFMFFFFHSVALNFWCKAFLTSKGFFTKKLKNY